MNARCAGMEPMLPDLNSPQLATLSRQVFLDAGALAATIPALRTRIAVTELVREMNSYYSNLIEGHKTYPRDIERALQDDYDSDQQKQLNQHLSRAHIEVECAVDRRLGDDPSLNVYDAQFIRWLHQEFYQALPDGARMARTLGGRVYELEYGRFRTYNVDVGPHTPPDYADLDPLMERFGAAYSAPSILPTNQLVAIAAAHHRLAWVHPFGDGNGRIARLQSHAALMQQGVGALGLWTISRGLARHRDGYYAALSQADRPRRNDYDGRGARTAQGLHEFCTFFLETMLDQIKFMGKLLALPDLLHRVGLYVHRDSGVTRHQERMVRLLCAVITEGEIPRGRIPDIVGLKSSAARLITRSCLDADLLGSATPKGAVHARFPAKVLDTYFPRLFLDLPG
jgi:Fic family protein